MPTPLRIAVLSFWHVHARDYANDSLAHPDTELVAVWDDDPDRGRAGADAFGVEFAEDLDVLLARADVDGVVITTATDQHHDMMTRAAAAGKHIFTEKLLAPTVAEAESIIAACDQRGLALVVSLPRLNHGYTLAIREVIDSGRLGTLTYARVRLSHDGAVADGTGWLPERFYEPAAAIGGALTDLGCHPVYLTQLFLGTRPDSVSATYRSVTGRPVDDNAVVTVGYPDGAIGVIEAGFVTDNPFTIEVFGTAGALAYSSVGDLVLHAGQSSEILSLPGDAPSAFEQWVGHIRNGTRAESNLARAVELTRLVVAANTSAASSTTNRYEGKDVRA